MNEGRVKNSTRNLFYAYVGQFLSIFLRFLIRSVFVKTFTAEYLGLNGLFSNILSFFSLAELGIGGAITYHLYVELAKNNNEQIKQLMKLYKRTYIYIGCFILVGGSSLIPFLDFFVPNGYEVPNIRLIYFLFVLNSGSSYFFSYKANYIIANQKNYIVTNVNNFSMVVITAFQLAILSTVKNYIAYLVAQITIAFISNVFIVAIANRMYPILKEEATGRLDENSKHTIIQNVFAAIFHRIGGIIVFSTDNILISKLFGLLVVGKYSNYTLVTKTAQSIISQFFSSITASVGNLCAESEKGKKLEIFYTIEYLSFVIFTISSICIYELLDEFIGIWLNSSFLMEKCIVFLLSFNFYLEGMRYTVQTFNGAMGLSRFYKFMPIPECIINLISSIILGKYFGPAGILIGTSLSTIATCFWVEPHVLFKHGFGENINKYYVVYFKYLLIAVICFLLVHSLNSLIDTDVVLLQFIVHLVVCLSVSSSLILVATFKTAEFKYSIKLLEVILRRLPEKT